MIMMMKPLMTVLISIMLMYGDDNDDETVDDSIDQHHVDVW